MDLTAVTPGQLAGWTPIRLDWAECGPVVDWCNTTGEHFVDPFFDQTVERCLRHPFRLLFRHRTGMATLQQVAEVAETLPLAGLVFHCSRCGSTLVSQMLAQLPSTLVMAEPGPVHSVLSAQDADPGVSEKEVVDWLRALVAVLGQRRRPGQRHLVVKLDAWAVLYLPLILQAYPTIPWVFLYRDPVEVLVSHVGHRGYHMIPGCLPVSRLGIDPGDLPALGAEDYMAWVVGSLFGAAARYTGRGRSMLVQYHELPDAVAGRVVPWFGIETDPGDVARMAEASKRDAKNQYLAYASDSGAKQQRASDGLREASRKWAQPQYRTLEAQREAGP